MCIRAPGAGSGPLRVPIGGCHRIRVIRRLGCILAGGLLAFSAMSPTAFAYPVPPPSGSVVTVTAPHRYAAVAVAGAVVSDALKRQALSSSQPADDRAQHRAEPAV